MPAFGQCDVCTEWKSLVASLLVTVSSMGSRKDRVQKFTGSLRVCRKCTKDTQMSRLLMARTRETLQTLLHEQWGKSAEREADDRFNFVKANAKTGKSLHDL